MTEKILTFPTTPLAGNKILAAMDILDLLENIPMSELSKVELLHQKDGMALCGYDALMSLGKGFYELAYQVRAQAAREGFSGDIVTGRITP